MKKLAVLPIFFLVLVSCSKSDKDLLYVDLAHLEPLPTQMEEMVPLRVAVAAVISPQGTVESYSDLMDYLSEKTGRPVEMEQRRTYLEINDMVKRGEIDVAVVCTGAYILGKDDFGMDLLVAPEVNGETVYYSILIVPSDSPAQDITDLQGKVFAFTDPVSLSGRMYPTSVIERLGSTPDDFFSRTFFTYSHDEAINAVASNLADGAHVDSLVYEYAIARDPELGEKTKILEWSVPFGIPPVVVNPAIPPQVKKDLQDLFLEMADTVQGLKALDSLGIDQFVLINDSAYQGARNLINQIGFSESQ
jgi:phosphonate transport system substrate-binding protein